MPCDSEENDETLEVLDAIDDIMLHRDVTSKGAWENDIELTVGRSCDWLHERSAPWDTRGWCSRATTSPP